MFNDPSEFSGVDSLCNRTNMVATQDFRKGVTCGKRDSAVFYDADLPESFTNPGEWPWAVVSWLTRLAVVRDKPLIYILKMILIGNETWKH